MHFGVEFASSQIKGLNLREKIDEQLDDEVLNSLIDKIVSDENFAGTFFTKIRASNETIEAKYSELENIVSRLNSRRIVLSECRYPSTGKSGYQTGKKSVLKNTAWNQMDGFLEESSCPVNQVMVARQTAHGNEWEDRTSAYKCCSISFTDE